jgi:hypothetical protein
VYVLNDGGETDLDLGNYERYLDVSLGRDNNVTTGKVYQYVIEREVLDFTMEGRVVKLMNIAEGRLPRQDGADRAAPYQRGTGLD